MLTKRHSVDALFVMLLYGLYTLLSLLIVFTGTRVYKGIMDSAEERSVRRVALYYTANKIRSGDALGRVSLDRVEGEGVVLDAVVIRDESHYGGMVFVSKTLIYEYEGKLLEQALYDDQPFYPSLGMEITEVSGFCVREEGGVFTISVTSPEGDVTSVEISRRTPDIGRTILLSAE